MQGLLQSHQAGQVIDLLLIRQIDQQWIPGSDDRRKTPDCMKPVIETYAHAHCFPGSAVAGIGKDDTQVAQTKFSG